MKRSHRLFSRSAGILVLVATLLAAGARAAQAQVKVVGGDILSQQVDDTQKGPAAISMVGARNGTFSGKVVLTSSEPIQGLKAVLGELKSGEAKLPPAAGAARCATSWESIPGYNAPAGPDMLQDAPPADLPSGTAVWVTVQVPKDAKAGVYTGQLTLEAKGLAATKVPVKLDVRDWTLPDSQDYRSWVELIQQPDTLALEYKVPLWSEKHFALIAQSLRIIATTGSRVVTVPLIAGTNYGNAESMVRWIKKGEGKYEYDFTVLEKYLDAVEKNMGKPRIVRAYAWETYLRPLEPGKTPATVEVKGAEGSYEWREAMALKKRIENANRGPAVTQVDPASGKTETIYLPRYEKPEAKALWKPVWDGLRQRLAKHGWEKSLMVGEYSDYYPATGEAAVLNELSGGAPWSGCAHHINSVKENVTLGKVGTADIGYAASALDQQYSLDPAKGGRLYGWKQNTLYAQYHRFQVFNGVPLNVRTELERMITANKRGLAHIGGDFWPCLRNNSGRRVGTVTDRFPESYWHSLNVMGWLLAPGAAGPIETVRLQLFREGTQECEARIAIESVLSDAAKKERLGGDLAKKAQDCLDERLVAIWKGIGVTDEDIAKTPLITYYRDWYFGVAKRLDPKAGLKWYLASGWQERDGKLFDLAGEVNKKLGAP